MADALGQRGSNCVTAAPWEVTDDGWAFSAAVTWVWPTIHPEPRLSLPRTPFMPFDISHPRELAERLIDVRGVNSCLQTTGHGPVPVELKP